jgi:hypothetical protein
VYFCGAVSYSNTDLVGAHVQKGGGTSDQKWYIYPLCNRQNQETGELEVSSDYKLVSVNKKETCDRLDPRSSGASAGRQVPCPLFGALIRRAMRRTTSPDQHRFLRLQRTAARTMHGGPRETADG